MIKILFPTDFSPESANAFDYAMGLAKQMNAKIDLLHIYQIAFSDASGVPYDYFAQLMKEKEMWISNEMDKMIAIADPQYMGQRKSSYGVFTADDIADYASANDIDYIVMGTTGRDNAIERLIGSVTTSVIMKVDCPVIAVPAEATYQPIDDIAFATSFEASDEFSIEQLKVFALHNKAKLHMVHVNTKSNDGAIKHIAENDGIHSDFTEFCIVNNYSVSRGLDIYANAKNMDMLALSIPRRRFWERLFHQSTVKKFALHSKTPLIAIHG